MQTTILNSLINYTNALAKALEFRDKYTRLHTERVAALADELAAHINLTQAEKTTLYVAANFHDIGKIGIPDKVLYKRGAFTADDWETMKTHSKIGEEILKSIDLPEMNDASGIVRAHHEHFDGSGYPDNLGGEEIPLLARVLSIADGYDAITEHRPYHSEKTHEAAISILQSESGVKYDPALLDEFVSVISRSRYKAH